MHWVNQQVKQLEQLQLERAESDGLPAMRNIQQLHSLRGVGWQSSWGLCMEFFNWRQFKNSKQVGACAGLTPTPYDSGDSTREQGMVGKSQTVYVEGVLSHQVEGVVNANAV
jgi:transposase